MFKIQQFLFPNNELGMTNLVCVLIRATENITGSLLTKFSIIEVVKGMISTLPQISIILKRYSYKKYLRRGERIIYFHKVNSGEANLCFY